MNGEKPSLIFFVEDDVDLLDMLMAYFQVQGYKVASALRGDDAVTRIGEMQPDIVVMDIHLPDMDGYEICRRLRQQRRTQQTPVIFLTQKAEREDKISGLELGAVDYITKPFDIQELRLRVRNALRQFRLGNLLNPVTGLPVGRAVFEMLETARQQPSWAAVLVSIKGLDRFRNQYGFVTADDVSRAVAIMIANVLQEVGGERDFIGHTDTGDFIIVTLPDRAKRLADRTLALMRHAVSYFYPAQDRERLSQRPESDRLVVRIASLSSEQHGRTSLDSILGALESQLA